MSNQPSPSEWHPNERKHRDKERRYWRLSLYLSTAVAIGAGFSAGFAYKAVVAGQDAAFQAKRQAEIAQQQLVQSRLSSRPYVIAQISKDQLAQGTVSTDGFGNSSYGYTARVRFKNFGTTPAIIKHIEGAVALTLPNDKALFAEEHVTELILSQGDSTKEYNWSRQANPQEAMNIAVGNGSVYIIGKVIYADTSGQVMNYEFCYFWPIHSHSPETQLVPAYGSGCLNRSS